MFAGDPEYPTHRYRDGWGTQCIGCLEFVDTQRWDERHKIICEQQRRGLIAST